MKCTTVAYVSCISDIIRLMIEKGIEVAILVLTEAKNSYGQPTFPLQTT